MKRASALACIVVLSVVLGGCGKDESRSDAPAVANAASVSEANAVARKPDEPLAQPGVGQSPAAVRQTRDDTLGTVAVAQLPKQAVQTLRLIEAGGPFRYEKDGVVFGNRERLLPQHPRGYYHEYTVPTPRARDRGARRIVCGGPKRQIGDCFYSDDHYASFKRIAG
ncbi:ribonuclease [Caballeronia sp. Lep1P3]|uniref:ribonuclease n=1 Tax=Caballeronia sp. Lep1P3 TaxID=2878150 RepID=UPI001FD30376|nr:ribonuclease [Caballeronia sp. Lep1P3]